MRDPGFLTLSDPLASFEKQGMLKLVAPAKVNLFLGVGGRRQEGYHEVVTVMHALSLHDVLHMDYLPESAGGLCVELECYAREDIEALDIPPEENIVVRAIRLLAHKLGRDSDETFRVRLEKHIPFEAGLGGGSSDAAAALVGAARLWGLEPRNPEADARGRLPHQAPAPESFAPEVQAVAGELGSDVSFFLYGGCACLTGFGDEYSHRLDPMKKAAVLVKPENGISTQEAYSIFADNPVSVPEGLAQTALSVRCADDVPLFNNLAQASETICPQLAAIRAWLEEQPGIEGALLCGSGSTTLALCESFDVACRISGKAQQQGWWARATSFSSLRAQAIPPVSL